MIRGSRAAASPKAAANCARPSWAATRSGCERLVLDRPQRPDDARVDLGLGQRPRQRLEQRPAQMEGVARELEVEEGRLPFLVLAGGRQHVVGVPGRLRHRHVDHDCQLERVERLAEPLRVRERVGRVGALDQHRPEAVGMVGQDLLRDHVARHQPADDRACW